MSTKSPDKRTLQVITPAGANRLVPRKHFARWRALSLSLVYVVFAIHIVHWKLTGKTLAPLELNEVMYTLELGIITAGFLFMCVLVLGTLIFGRFFCSWACHIMVLQDLCGWILRKLGIRPKLIRSRLLSFVPPLTALYMFVWPQIVRSWQTRSIPTFHLATDADGWASFITNNFWRNLPGPGIIIVTFLVCGFVMVYLLGSRTFCTYVCPYGAVFGLADRFALGRIRVNNDCVQCGQCTAACTSGIRVHEETKRDGMVVNSACLRDFDCVSACPRGALSYRFGKPALFRSYFGLGRFGLPYDFSIVEELVATAVFIVVLLTFRGLYGQIPFLLSLALGVIIGCLSVVAMRIATAPSVLLSVLRLKERGQCTRFGIGYIGFTAVLVVLVVHSAFVRFHEYMGLRGVIAIENTAEAGAREWLAGSTYRHLQIADHWGLLSNVRTRRGMVIAAMQLKQYMDVVRIGGQFLQGNDDERIRLLLGAALAEQGRLGEAERELRRIVESTTYTTKQTGGIAASAYQTLGGILSRRGDFAGATDALQNAARLDPGRAAVHAELGSALAELGRFDEAIASLGEAVRLDSGDSRANYNLGTLLGMQGRFAEAVPYYELALAITPEDVDLHNNCGFALFRLGRMEYARKHLERAIALNPNHADAHFNLGALLAASGQRQEAEGQLRIAARLDARYGRLLSGQ